MLINALLVVVSFAAMEGVAWLAHRYVMHGPLWSLHESHHVPHKGWLELNDWFAVFFSLPSIAMIYFGTHGYPTLLWIGIGIAAYGLAYFIFHDIVVHRRLRLPFPTQHPYMRRIIQAHLIHHKVHTRDGAQSFGFLYARPPDKSKR